MTSTPTGAGRPTTCPRGWARTGAPPSSSRRTAESPAWPWWPTPASPSCRPGPTTPWGSSSWWPAIGAGAWASGRRPWPSTPSPVGGGWSSCGATQAPLSSGAGSSATTPAAATRRRPPTATPCRRSRAPDGPGADRSRPTGVSGAGRGTADPPPQGGQAPDEGAEGEAQLAVPPGAHGGVVTAGRARHDHPDVHGRGAGGPGQGDRAPGQTGDGGPQPADQQDVADHHGDEWLGGVGV